MHGSKTAVQLKLILSQAILAYQSANPGSRAFNTRLIDLVAVSVHQIAVILFKLDTSLHKDSGIVEWQPSRTDEMFWDSMPQGLPPAIFFHEFYVDHDQYPDGVADIVGYWAESCILGGVILFDRNIAESDAVYIHPDRRHVTYRICKLLDVQKKSLLDFLTDEGATPACPLPIIPDRNNMPRVDPEEPLSATGVYRDLWERKDLPQFGGADRRATDVLSRMDWPTDADWNASKERWMDKLIREDELLRAKYNPEGKLTLP